MFAKSCFKFLLRPRPPSRKSGRSRIDRPHIGCWNTYRDPRKISRFRPSRSMQKEIWSWKTTTCGGRSRVPRRYAPAIRLKFRLKVSIRQRVKCDSGWRSGNSESMDKEHKDTKNGRNKISLMRPFFVPLWLCVLVFKHYGRQKKEVIAKTQNHRQPFPGALGLRLSCRL